jgi:hypothetical protein
LLQGEHDTLPVWLLLLHSCGLQLRRLRWSWLHL